MNLYEGILDIAGDGGTITMGTQTIGLSPESLTHRPALRGYDGKQVIVGIRPEDFEDAALAGDIPENQRLTSKISLIEALGSEIMVDFAIDARRVDSGDPDAVEEAGSAASVGRFNPLARADGSAGRDRRRLREHPLLRQRQPPRDLGLGQSHRNRPRPRGAAPGITGGRCARVPTTPASRSQTDCSARHFRRLAVAAMAPPSETRGARGWITAPMPTLASASENVPPKSAMSDAMPNIPSPMKKAIAATTMPMIATARTRPAKNRATPSPIVMTAKTQTTVPGLSMSARRRS